MTFISDPTIDKEEYVKRLLGNDCTQEQIVEKIAELEYLEEIEDYKILRASAYPSYSEQLDYIYHNGVDAWKTDIVDPVKAQYSKAEIDETELASRKAQALFDYQLAQYTKAQERLSQYEVAIGKAEVTEEVVVGQEVIATEEGDTYKDIVETRVVSKAIDPVDATIETVTYDSDTDTSTVTVIENPEITKDNEERAAAQAIVDATPQEVIDAYNAL